MRVNHNRRRYGGDLTVSKIPVCAYPQSGCKAYIRKEIDDFRFEKLGGFPKSIGIALLFLQASSRRSMAAPVKCTVCDPKAVAGDSELVDAGQFKRLSTSR